MDQFSGGNWSMIPNNNNNNNSLSTTPNQDHNFLNQQQQFHYQQHFQPQPQQPPHILQQQQQQNQEHQSLPSHIHLYPLVEKLAGVIENGARDQQSDSLVTEVTYHFEKCQQLLNSISDSISSRPMTVDGRKQKLKESNQLLTRIRDSIAKYKSSIEEIVKTDGFSKMVVPRGGRVYRYPPGRDAGILTCPYVMGPPAPFPIGALASALANATPEQQRTMLGENLYPLVEQVEPEAGAKVTGMLLEMDQTEVLHLLESPDALKAKVGEAMDVLRTVSQQPTLAGATADQLASLSLNNENLVS